MNFHMTKAFRFSTATLIVLGLTLPMVSGSFAATAKTIIPKVTARHGVVPVIGKPVGAAPKVLTAKDIFLGKGKVATATSIVTAQYVLMSWKSGRVLQSSWSTGPFTSPLSGVIRGWQLGIPGMKAGGRRILIIPPALAYGAAGGGPVGPNETLIFVVDLLGVK